VSEVFRETIMQVLRQRSRGGEGYGLNADMHEELVADRIIEALHTTMPELFVPTEPEHVYHVIEGLFDRGDPDSGPGAHTDIEEAGAGYL